MSTTSTIVTEYRILVNGREELIPGAHPMTYAEASAKWDRLWALADNGRIANASLQARAIHPDDSILDGIENPRGRWIRLADGRCIAPWTEIAGIRNADRPR